MKTRIASLTILCLALVSIPAWAGYDNGPINGTTDAWTINFGYIVSDTFTLSSSQTITGFQFGVWLFPGDIVSTVDWSITSGENSGTVYGSGTAMTSGNSSGGRLSVDYISTNQFGYDISQETVSGLNLGAGSGNLPAGTYWLNLQNAAVPSGDPVFWDENSGAGCKSNGCPSMASESAVGTIASEAFTINTGGSGTTPEPSSIMLFGSGILGLAGVLRRKLF